MTWASGLISGLVTFSATFLVAPGDGVRVSDGGTIFYVDGNIVASTLSRPIGRQRVEIWIDNRAVVGGELHELPVAQKSSLEIDYVRWTRGP